MYCAAWSDSSDLRHAHAARGIGHVDHRPFVMRRDLHRRVHAAGGGAADQQRDLPDAEVLVLLHLAGHVLHLFQAGRDQARQADDVRALDLGPGQDLVARHHHAHVHHLEVVALQDHGDDVLADVVHVALDGGDDDLALGRARRAPAASSLALFFLDVGDQVRHRLLHHARRLDHLRQEHLAGAEQVADDVHAVHQRAFDHVQRAAAPGQDFAVGLLGVLDDEVGDAVHQRVRQALRHRHRLLGRAAPFELACSRPWRRSWRVSAISTSRSPASGRRLSTTSSTRSRSSGSMSS